MTTLYRRATPSQRVLTKIIEGSIKNALDSHPGKREFTVNMVRSITKRAVGTLTANWPDVLAAKDYFLALSERARGLMLRGPSPSKSKRLTASKRGASQAGSRRSPLLKLHKDISRQMRFIKDSGNAERAQAMIDVMRMISNLSRNHER